MTRKMRKIRWRIYHFWLEDFADSLEVTELHPHTVLATQIPNILQKSCHNRGSTVVIHTSRKHRKCDICLWTKITSSLYRRRSGEAVLRAEKFGDLITADHKVLNEGGESRDNHWYAVVYKISPLNGFKTKVSQETEKSLLQFLELSQAPRVIFGGFWWSMWRIIMESPHSNTSSIRDERHRWLSRPTSGIGHISSIATVRTR